VKGGCTNLSSVICSGGCRINLLAALSFIPIPLARLLAIGYWLLAIPSESGAVVEVDRDQEEDSFDHVERDIGDGEAKQKPEWA
jgi:hypothetical protein